jgi:TolB-like protein/DNA-binding winged helix-turn-helix (wHTH) protein/tetratricopeptide (TPR) repeat protein
VQPAEPVAFGPFELDAAERTLLRDRRLVALTPRAFDLLVVLVSRAGELVKREDLLRDVWRDAFVEEANLNYTVSVLRKALGDRPDRPTYIETVSKHGYRFIAPVRSAVPSSPGAAAPGPARASRPSPPDAATPGEPVRGSWRRRRFAAVAIVAIGAGLASLLLSMHERRSAHGAGRPVPQVTSIAVLPLTNLTGSKEDEWFADGMTDALIAELSRVSDLKVISRNSAMRYKQTDKRLTAVSEELGVDGLLTGSVLRDAGRVRITVQLHHGPTENMILGTSYQKELRSVLALHAEIALDVARRVRVQVGADEKARLSRVRPVNRETYEAVLRGRASAATLTAEGLSAAIAAFRHALTSSPDDPVALAELARASWTHDSFFGLAPAGMPIGEARARLIAMAERAVRLDDTLASAHATLGWFRFWTLDWAASERAFLRAIELDASNADARHGYAYYLTTMGRFDDAIVQMRHARELDPRSTALATAAHWPFYCARRFDDAASELADARVLEPRNPTVLLFLGNVRSWQGRHDEALAAFRDAAALGAADSIRYRALLAGAYARAGRTREADAALAELRSRGRNRGANPMWVARAHSAAGRAGPALVWLERAYEESTDLTVIRDPVWDGVREAPRFRAVLQRMGLADVPPTATAPTTSSDQQR